MISTIDNFIKWLKNAKYIKDLIIRLVVVLIVLGIGGLLWFISVPIIGWYLFVKYGNKPLKSCECSKCYRKNSCDDNYCIFCGNNLKQQSSNQSHCKCDNCNKIVNCNDNFCEFCGSSLNNRTKQSSNYNQIVHSFDGILVALIAKVAKADGRVCEEEANYISELFTNLSKHRSDIPNIRDVYKEIMNNEKDNLENIGALCIELTTFDISEREKIDLIRILIELAYIDSEYDKVEENLIVKIVHNLYIDFSIYQNIKSEFETYSHNDENNHKEKYNGGRLSLSEAYKILEVSESDSDKTIKESYRRLVKQYHYDSIVSKGLPKDMIDFAEEKLKMINAAYDVIKKYRGL